MAVALVGCGGGAGPKAAINGGVETYTHAASIALDRAKQRLAIESAINTAHTAVRALDLESTDEDIAKAKNLIDAIGPAIMAGVNVPAHELTDARAMRDGIQSDLAAREMANGKVNELTDNLATATAKVSMLTDELGTATAKVSMLTGELAMANSEKDDLQDKLTAANAMVADLTTKLGTANSEKDDLQTQLTAANAMVTDLTTKLGTATDKVEELNGELADANSMVATLTAARDEYKAKLDTANAELAELRQEMADAKTEAERKELIATARKLHAGISMPTATDTNTDDTATTTGTRFAQHAAADGANAGDIEVAINTDANVFLSEDKKTEVADNAGWEGMRFTHTTPADEGTYEAVVYSNIGDPTEGDPFNEKYTLADGVVTLVTGGSAVTDVFAASNVGGSNFDHSAGVKQFKLPSDDPSGPTKVAIAGSYHGVSGTYSCTPGPDNACGVRVAESGFELGTVATANNEFTNNGGTWTFRPSDANTKVSSQPDQNYASYGWWLHKSEDGDAFTASAFVDERGTVADAEDLDALNGSATYMGGAAGKYALTSSTGGTNDAGHFTADATLEADFTNNETATAITGTIDNFVGADGESRDWEVELKGAQIGNEGQLNTTGETDGLGAATVWTIGETAADASGQWTGSLRDNGDDGVPKVATGTFYTQYGEAGRMVGAFGANRQ